MVLWDLYTITEYMLKHMKEKTEISNTMTEITSKPQLNKGIKN